LRVFGQLRTAGGRTADVQFRARGSKAWKSVASRKASGHGFVVVAVRRARAGSYRIAWSGDGASRAVGVRPRR
jgi:predicted lipoprotein